MNTQLIDTLVQIINTLSPTEREILEQKLHPKPLSISSDDWTKEPFIGMWKRSRRDKKIVVLGFGNTLDEVVNNLKEAVSWHLEDEDPAEFGLLPNPTLITILELQPEYA